MTVRNVCFEKKMTTQTFAKVVGCTTYLQVAGVVEVAAQCEHTPGSKGQMPCMCFLDMTQFPIPAVLQQQRKSTTDKPASKAVGIQGASCRSCQHGLKALCQLIHCDGVTGHLVQNIKQPALPSQQVPSEHCTPCRPALLTYMYICMLCLYTIFMYYYICIYI